MLYQKYRPTHLGDVFGQAEAVGILRSLRGNLPHSILFTGPSGCGKTTLARILKTELECGDPDFTELNCADFRGIDMVREVRNRMGLAPISGKCRIWLIDECHKLTNDAQNAMLKMLEDTPRHIYFMLATTEPGKLLKTILNRCTSIAVKAINNKQLCELVARVSELEKTELSDEAIEKIAELADGSARAALVMLESVIGLPTPEEQIEALEKSDSKRASIDICRALLNPRTKWPEMCIILKGVDEEPETLRRMILGYATSVMLGGGKMVSRAFLIIQACRDHWYDCGRAGLVSACFEVISNKE